MREELMREECGFCGGTGSINSYGDPHCYACNGLGYIGRPDDEPRIPSPWRRRLLRVARFVIWVALAVTAVIFFIPKPAILIYIGDRFMDYGHLEKAKRCYERSISLALGHNYAAYRRMGYLLLAQGSFDEAKTNFCQALRFEHDDPWTYFNLGVALTGMGEYEQARVSYRRAIRDWPDRVAPDGALNEDELDIVHLAAPDEWRILEACLPVRLEPPIIGLTNVREARKSFSEAYQRTREAEARFRQAVQVNPADVLALNSLGMALRAEERLPEAEASFRQAIRLHPEYAPAHNNLGNVLKARGRLDEAEASYLQAIALDPDLGAAVLNLETLKRFRERRARR